MAGSRPMKLALAGDTMLGRAVGERIGHVPLARFFSPELVEVVHEADAFVLNLECAISDRGERWPDPAKPFFFRAPPGAVELLRLLDVDCVTLANNHALDYGVDALADTLTHLQDAGISFVGAGLDEAAARTPATIVRSGRRIEVVGVTDHPADFGAGVGHPGVAYADLQRTTPPWLLETLRRSSADVALVSPHWGPNMTPGPLQYVRRAAADLIGAGATLVAGHSAHVFHGVEGHVLYDLGDFIDDYATDPLLRNDLGLLFFVTFEGREPRQLEAVPLALDFCRTRLADADETAWIARRFEGTCRELGTQVSVRRGRLYVDWCPQRRTA